MSEHVSLLRKITVEDAMSITLASKLIESVPWTGLSNRELMIKLPEKPPELTPRRLEPNGRLTMRDVELLMRSVLRPTDKLPSSREKITRLLSRLARKRSLLASRLIERLLRREELSGKLSTNKVRKTELLVSKLKELSKKDLELKPSLMPKPVEPRPSQLLKLTESSLRLESLPTSKSTVRELLSVMPPSGLTSPSVTPPIELPMKELDFWDTTPTLTVLTDTTEGY